MPHPLPARPQRDPKLDPPRSVDAFYDEAHAATAHQSSFRFGYWLIFLSLGVANSGDATEIGSMNFILSSDGFREEMLGGGDFSGRGAAIASSIFAGMLIGGIVTGAFGDRTGRRPTLLLGLSLNATAGVASAISPNTGVLCLCRFAAGLGIGAVLSSLVALATELSPPRRRGFYITFVASFWTLGSIYVAVLALVLFGGTRDASWRIFALLAAAPCAAGGALVWAVVPESARFLALRGRYDEAARAANAVADGMGYRGPPLEAEEVQHHFESEAASARPPIALPRTLSRMHSAVEHTKEAALGIRRLYGPELRFRSTVPLQLIWFTMSFGSGLCTWITKIFETIDLDSVYLYSLYFALANIPGNIAASALMDSLGRKVMLMLSMVFASLSLLLFAHGAESGSAGGRSAQVLFSACAFHAFLVVGWCAISCMTSELFPTDVRSTGMGVCAASGRIAAMIVQFVNGALIGRPSVLLTVASVSIMVGALSPAAFRMSEMKNAHLHDRAGGLHGHTGVVETYPSHVHFKRCGNGDNLEGRDVSVDGSSDPTMCKGGAVVEMSGADRSNGEEEGGSNCARNDDGTDKIV